MKDTWVQIRISQEEKAEWVKLAKALDVTLSQLIRDAMSYMLEEEE